MKKIISMFSLTLGLLVCATVLGSCSKDDDDKNTPSSSNPLIGTWRAEVEEKGEWQYWEMTFDVNNNYSIKEYNKEDNTIIHRSENGRYEIVGSNTLIITYSDGDTDTSKFIISDGNKLEFLDFDHDIIYYKIK